MSTSAAGRRSGAIAIAVVLAAVAASVVVAVPAYAATISVTTTADGDVQGACTDSAVTAPVGPVTLRTALCVAGNLGGSQTVTVPVGDYTLTDGALVVGTKTGSDITIAGPAAGTGTARLIGNGSTQLMTTDPGPIGGVSVTVQDLTFQGGRDSLFGGGAIIAGSPLTSAGDSLTVVRSVFTDNHSSAAAAPGGAIQFMGGSLTIQNSTFTSNDSGTSSGGAVSYLAAAAPQGQQKLSITGSTFKTNTAHTAAQLAGGGAAIAYSVDAGAAASIQISDNTFDGNAVTTADASPTLGGAIWQQGGSATVVRNVFTSNAAATGSAIDVTGGSLAANFNIFSGNSAPALASGSISVDATHNWWGCATGAGTARCDSASTTGSTQPHLTLTTSASPATILVHFASTLTASLLKDSAGNPVAASDLTAFSGMQVAWTGAAPVGSIVSTPSTFAGGVTSTSFTAGSAGGVGGAAATFENALVQADVTVDEPPTLAALPSPVALTAGTPYSLSLVAYGYPAPSVSMTGTLPAGLTFTPSAGGATISGTPTDTPPAAGDPVSSTVTFTATNTSGLPALTSVTFVLSDAPTITSSASSVAAVGTPFSYTVTATGRPAPTLSVAMLPAGISFVDHGDGTGTLSGTPAAALAGTHALTVTAQNAVGTATQSFELSVGAKPAFTSADTATFTAGTAGSFIPTVDPGFPTATTISLTGTLPSGVTFTAGAPGTAQLSGTPDTGTGGSYPLQLIATNATGATTQAFTLVVDEAPAVTTPPVAVSVLAGDPVSLSAAASGFPAPTVQWQRSDGGGPWTDVSGATSTTLGFTAALADDGASFRAVFTNVAGSTPSSAATVTVSTKPSIASVSPVTVLPGAARTIDITASGHPTPALTATGVPPWLTLTDNGDGTATLHGTPGVVDAGSSTITVTATNAAGSFFTTVTVDVALDVALPATVPTGDGPLTETPAQVKAGGTITVSGAGFLPGTTVEIGMYSAPTMLGSATVDGSGAFSASLTIPAAAPLGAHTVAAIGVSATGDTRTLTAPITVVAANSGGSGSGSSSGSGSTTGSGSSALSSTGGTVPFELIIGGLLALLVGCLIVWRVRRAR
ncbi:beta strand repeat-containing protein [Microbacterium sp. ASV49]|uniref:Ig domain-containing protein n=1 Tax=Microbacterium candidum TaxID=3041922 RepID=A0ABT7MYI6_9MICO|nr:putative Ig domain-containing protein [Microbacterium sp. ASV49]MDL9979512.1 putative Ig domain-containing protein [Microbacterium sp. ASV49]